MMASKRVGCENNKKGRTHSIFERGVPGCDCRQNQLAARIVIIRIVDGYRNGDCRGNDSTDYERMGQCVFQLGASSTDLASADWAAAILSEYDFPILLNQQELLVCLGGSRAWSP